MTSIQQTLVIIGAWTGAAIVACGFGRRKLRRYVRSERAIADSLKDKEHPEVWFYVSYRDKETDTYFMGAAVVRTTGGFLKAFDEGAKFMPEDCKIGELTELEADEIPPAEARECLLTRAEVLQLWPNATKGNK